MLNVAATILRWSMGIVIWGIISYWSRHSGLIRFSTLLQLKPTLALWGLIRVPDSVGWHDSARSRWCSFPFVLFLYLLFIVSQVSEVFLLSFVPRGQGFAPSSLQPSLTHTVAAIGVDLTYAELGGLSAYLPINSTGNWWDTNYRLMVSSKASLSPATLALDKPDVLFRNTAALQSSFLEIPLGTFDLSSNKNSILTATEIMTSIPMAISSTDPIYTHARVFLPVTDVLGKIVYNRSNVLQQVTWPSVAGTGAGTGTSLDNSYWRAEIQLTLDSGYQVHASTGMRGYPELNQTWTSVLFATRAALASSQSIQVDGGAATAAAYGDYLCMTGNTADGRSAGIVMVPNLDAVTGKTTGLRYVAVESDGTAAAYPHLYLSHSLVLSQVMRCRAYTVPGSTSPSQWWLAACTGVAGSVAECGNPVLQGVLDSSVAQPVGVIDFHSTILNLRVCDQHCMGVISAMSTMGNQGATTSLSSSTSTVSYVSYYIPYELTVAWISQSNVLHFDTEQCWPGVCTQSGLCSGSSFPLWLLICIVVIAVLAVLVLAIGEDLSNIVLHGFLQTTGPYGFALDEGVGALRSDTLCYLHTSHHEGYVGVRSHDTLFERSRFMADPGERLARGRESVKVTSLSAGRRLAKTKGLTLE
ncbi:hypothetical protein BASA61_003930 [Batrachochytrium salamandrivorans]|nr:hypothetical protein BASA60_008926 [Batrachochytrium salamandrivorans]KAH6568499.1 hypothetical protein BASA62_005440 [Batrachochytrium salamandrivorans]KAH6594992.1 hypothetical protein BASA61_003930 [Batrachochytrium salamandrivorans]KAH9244433.1 hypothetical protein BASA81_018168 [Batrachochytrium salamandrivorans]KAH9273454.1 hypothetical protein BASA83_004120 [Batrachochytrium salamandrivorans]